MDFSPTEDQRLILEAVEKVCAKLEPQFAGWDEENRIDPEAFREVAALGFSALCLEDAGGGPGLSYGTALLALEALAAGSPALALRVAAHTCAALPALTFAGFSGAPLEPWTDGGAWLAVASELELRNHRDVCTLEGDARWVVGGGDSGGVVVLTPSFDVYLVDGEPEGLSRLHAESLGMRGASFAHLTFEGVRVDAPVGRLDEFHRARWASLWRLGWAAVGVGLGRAALARAAAYALERRQFGRPIAGFQAIQWMLADSATEVDAARLLLQRGALELDSGLDASAASLSALMAASEAALASAQRAIQVHGGYGFVKEFVVERWARDARYLGLALGGAERWAAELGERM